MMYSKLAFRNIRRSLRDYIIYFVTLTLTAALMYSFLALGFSPDILAMTENMSMLTSGILMLSVLVALLSSFVVGYAIRFMLGQRKKEFAAYELMGMEVKTVRNLFLVENGIIGGVAFLLGALIGTGLSGLLNQVIQNIFEVPHTYRVLFSFRAWGMTLFFFILMYALHGQIAVALRKIHHLEKDNRKPANGEAREYMIERMRKKLRRRGMRTTDSQLEELIVALVNTEQYHYGFEGTRELSIYQFNESVRQVIKKIDYDNKMHGIYAGTVSAKDLSQDDLNWLTHK